MVADYRDDHRAALDELLLRLPGVTGGKAFGYPAYRFGRKIFCFVGGGGIAIKLPPARVQALADEQPDVMRVFEVADGVRWRGWLSIDRAVSEAYHQDWPLLEEALTYVSSGAA